MSNFISQSRNHIVLSVSPHRLCVVHLRRTVFGWRRLRTADFDLVDNGGNLQQLESELSACVSKWDVPPATRVHWILAGDILGVVSTATGESIESVLPFSSADVHTQTDRSGKAAQPSVFWIHNDWLAEIERISSICRLELVELFPRAQLFQREATSGTNSPFTAVIETEGTTVFLHIFGPDGGVLRSSVLSATSISASQSLLEAEFASIEESLSLKGKSIRILVSDLSATLPGWERYELARLSDEAFEDRLVRLFHSRLEGIPIRSMEDTWLKTVKIASGVTAIVGLAILAAVSWMDTRLEKDLAEFRAQARVQAPKVLEAKTLNRDVREMEAVVREAEKFNATNEVFDSFRILMTNFPPAPAALLYARIEPNSISFSGSGTRESMEWLNGKMLPGYLRLTESIAPDFLKEAQPTLNFLAMRAPGESAPAGESMKPTESTGATEKL